MEATPTVLLQLSQSRFYRSCMLNNVSRYQRRVKNKTFEPVTGTIYYNIINIITSLYNLHKFGLKKAPNPMTFEWSLGF